MKITVLTILLVTLTTVHSIPVNSVTEDAENYTSTESSLDETTQQPGLNQKRVSDLESAEFHYPIFVIKYPLYHGYYGHHGYIRPHWHHWHGGHGWGPYYGGFYNGIGHGWIY